MMEETSIFNAIPVFSPTDKSSSTNAGASAHDHEMRTPEATSDHSPDSPPEDQMVQDTDEPKTSIDCRATHSEGAICTDDIAIDHGRTSADSSRTSKKFSQPKQPKLPRKTCHGIKRAIKPPKKDAKYWTLRYWCNWRGCEWRFATPYNLERHILMHARQEGLMSEVPMIPCPVDGCKTQCTRKENICSHLWEGHQIREKCPCCGKTFESGEKSYGSDELYKHLTHPASTCGVKLVRIDKSAVTGFRK
ncbi:hypothetical protein CPB86DRAFT_781444 [Serendipita vermifera]|nr:hypothetical protein CPB86DRAFT_781444 [Serendipita vermifera]